MLRWMLYKCLPYIIEFSIKKLCNSYIIHQTFFWYLSNETRCDEREITTAPYL